MDHRNTETGERGRVLVGTDYDAPVGPRGFQARAVADAPYMTLKGEAWAFHVLEVK